MAATTDYHHSLGRGLDFACVLCGFAGAARIASFLSSFGLFIWPTVPAGALAGWPPDYEILLVFSLVSWSVVSAYFGIRGSQFNIESYRYGYWRTVRTVVVWAAVTETSTFLFKLQTVSRQFTLSFTLIAGALIIARRFLESRWSSVSKRKARKALIIGTEHEANWLASALATKPEWSSTSQTAELARLPELAAQTIANQLDSDVEFFILPTSQDMSTIETWTLQLLKQKRAVHIVPAIFDTSLFRQSLGDLEGVPLITLEPGRLADFEGGVKRLLDVAVALVALVVFAPLMALVAALVKASSPGPVIFSQERLGKDRRPFKIYKFRTMRRDAEELLKKSAELHAKYLANNFKLPDGHDFRVTKIGRLLRATSLDELPQLINVLRGDMSLVGPRPIVPAEIEKYGEYAALLLSVKPGMTGQWQVNGRANVVDYSHRVRLDMEYIRDQSVRGDVELLVKTIAAVTRMEGAH